MLAKPYRSLTRPVAQTTLAFTALSPMSASPHAAPARPDGWLHARGLLKMSHQTVYAVSGSRPATWAVSEMLRLLRSKVADAPAIGIPSEMLNTAELAPRTLAWCLQASRSEEHTSELQSLMRISYAVLCLKKQMKLSHKNANTTQQPY